MKQAIEAEIAAIGRIDAVSAILEVICRTTGMGFAAVARVTQDRWVACAVRDEIAFGLSPGGELKVETTICDEIRDSGVPVIIDHVAEDEDFCGHPTPAMYGFQSYISMPIYRADQTFFGTLCAIDPKPAKVSRPEIRQMFKLFADLIAFHLDTQDQLASNTEALLTERQASELREQFLAVMSHDLRNPLAAIGAGIIQLDKEKLSPKGETVLALMGKSAARMSDLIELVLDLARARLGGGIGIVRNADAPLAPALELVIEELRSAWPARDIRANLAIDRPVPADHGRVARLLSNLLSNALTHGAPESPIRVEAFTNDAFFELFVANAGDPISDATAREIFRPYFRGAARASQQGLGLGLFIASEIARAHGGVIELASTREETRFTFRMPLA